MSMTEHASALPSCTRHAQVLEPLGMFVKTRSRCTAYWTINGEGGTSKNRMYGRWLAFALNPQQAAVLKAQVGDWACVCVCARAWGGGGTRCVAHVARNMEVCHDGDDHVRLPGETVQSMNTLMLTRWLTRATARCMHAPVA